MGRERMMSTSLGKILWRPGSGSSLARYSHILYNKYMYSYILYNKYMYFHIFILNYYYYYNFYYYNPNLGRAAIEGTCSVRLALHLGTSLYRMEHHLGFFLYY